MTRNLLTAETRRRRERKPQRLFSSSQRLCCELALGLVLVLLLALPSPARDYPPDVPPPRPITIPAPSMQTLPNGLQIVVVERHSLPMITLKLVVKAGPEFDPPKLPGVAQLLNAILTEGTTHRTSHEIALAIDSVGGEVDNGAGWDSSYLTLSVLSDQSDLAFDLVSDMIQNPAFDPAEIERQRKQTLSGLEVMHDDPSSVADTVAQDIVFAGTPYSHPEDGTLDSVRKINAADLRSFHARYYQPENCVLAVVGDITSAEAFARAARFFASWKNTSPPAMALMAQPNGSQDRQVIAIDKPDAVQTEIRIASLAVPRNSPDYLALDLANEILGGPAENRLFKALRSRSGLTYGASSDLDCHRTVGSWVAKTFTRTPETVKSIHVALDQIKSFDEHEISRGELETAESYLIGHLALEFETSDNYASKVLDLIQYGLPLDYWNTYPDNIRALSTDQIWQATKRYLDSDRYLLVLVGNLSDFKKDLKKLGPTRLIPLSDMDFGSPNLVPTPDKAGK